MRNSWTDDRLDDFRDETQRHFDEVDRRFDRLEQQMERGFSELTARFDALQHLLLRASVGVIAVLAGILATQL